MARTKTEKKAEQPSSSNKEAGLPLFFIKPALLDKQRHAIAGIKNAVDYSFARQTNSVPLNTLEFIEAMRCYPIVFTNEADPVPVAVLGWGAENYYINAKGEWATEAYIPAYVRQYPFVFVTAEDNETLLLAIDEASPHFTPKSSAKTQPLFVNDTPSPLTKRALEFCSSYYQHRQITQNFCADLKAHNLLTPYISTATIDGKNHQLNGFMMIDEKAFNALSDAVFLEFRQKGWLAFINLAMASASNWKYLMKRAEAK